MIKRVIQSTALQFGFATGEQKNGEEVYDMKTITNINGLASDEDIQAVAAEISPLYAVRPELVYRVDTAALEAA